MEVGLYLRDHMEDSDRAMYQQVEEAAEVCRRAQSLGFPVIYMPQDYVSHPSTCRPTAPGRASRASGRSALRS